MPVIPLAAVPRFYRDRLGPDAVALVTGDEKMTWEELESRANRRARLFRDLGVNEGAFVTISLPNGNFLFECSFATWKLGATPNIVSHKLPAAEFNAIADLVQPALIVGAVEHQLPGRCVMPASASASVYSGDPLLEPVAKCYKAMTTGGSTGRPKIIVDHSPAEIDPLISPFFRNIPSDVVLNPGPLFHNAPFMVTHSGLFAGNKVVNMQRFDAEETLRLIERHKATLVNFVPTMMRRIFALPEEVRRRYDVSSLRLVWHMAAPMPIWLKEHWIEWLGAHRIMELYGGTERQGFTAISGDEWLHKKGSVGKMAFGRIKVMREDGSNCAPGETGEIYFMPDNGPGSTYHYLGAEAKKTADGWESIGDMGSVDEDGYVFLADRRTDLVLRGGANVYPAEIESALAAHPQVACAIVVGLADEDLGQRAHALIETIPGAGLSVDDLHRFLTERIARYKLPESYEFIRGPLRDEAGKVRRSQLREERARWLQDGRVFQIRPAPLRGD